MASLDKNYQVLATPSNTLVCVGMAVSPPLSHSSQVNTFLRKEDDDPGVSDECSSGVVRVVQEASPYLVCVVGVQGIADL